MKILLVNPENQYNSLANFSSEAWLYFPLNILYLSAGLLDQDVEILDLRANPLSAKELHRKLLDVAPDIVGISAWIDNFPSTESISLAVKKLLPETKLVIGGPFASVAPELYLEKCHADTVITGDGAEGIRILLDKIEDEEDCPKIIRAGQFIPRSVSNIISVLKKHFPPDKMEQYLDGGTRFPGKRGMMVMGSFGCPYKCQFCSPRYLGQYCAKGLFSLEKEATFLKEEYGVDTIYFADPTFNLSRERVIDICQIMKDLGMKWYTEGRVDKIDPELAEIMADSGCVELLIGIESFDQKILNATSKDTTQEGIYDAVTAIKKAGISLIGFVLFGLPGQTEEEIDLTVDELRRLRVKVIPNLLFPIPGTGVWEYAKKTGQEPDLYQMVKVDFPKYNQEGRLHPIVNYSFASDQKLVETMKKIEQLNKDLNLA